MEDMIGIDASHPKDVSNSASRFSTRHHKQQSLLNQRINATQLCYQDQCMAFQSPKQYLSVGQFRVPNACKLFACRRHHGN